MSTILKSGAIPARPVSTSTFQMRDLQAEAIRIMDSARDQARRVLDEARAQVPKIFEHARREGFTQGHAEGIPVGQERGRREAFNTALENFQREQKQLIDSLQSLLKEVSAQREDRLRQAQDEILDFALDLAVRVTKTVGEIHREAVVANLRAALELVVGKSDLMVRTHPKDQDTLKKFMASADDPIHGFPHITIVEDPAIAPGGVKVISITQEIDATLDHQLDTIIRTLTATEQE